MSRYHKKRQALLVELFGLKPDEFSFACSGELDGYPVIASTGYDTTVVNNQERVWSFIFSLSRDGRELDPDFFRDLVSENKPIASVQVKGHRVVLQIKDAIRKETVRENLLEGTRAFLSFCHQKNLKPCCEQTGAEAPLQPVVIGSQYHLFSEAAYQAWEEQSLEKGRAEHLQKVNWGRGILGAFLGSLIGSVVIFILLRFGYIAYISGCIMAYATLALFKKFSGKINAPGVAFCLFLSAFMTYLTDRFDWSLYINEGLGIGLFNSFVYAHEIIKESGISGEYFQALGLLMLFVLLGIIFGGISYLRGQKAQKLTYRM